MKLRVAALAAAGVLGAAAFAVPSLADNPVLRNKYPSTSAIEDCGDGDTVTYNGPLKMWPPNHKLQSVSITAVDGPSSNPTDAAADGTTIEANVAATDVAGGDGGPNHDPDWTPGQLVGSGDGSATVNFWLRSERSGKGEGRTYTIDWTATFDDGFKSCSSMDATDDELNPFVVTVPHDMRGGADWK